MSFSSPLDQVKKVEYDDLFFQAIVKDVDDPEKLERVRVRIERVHDEVPDDKLPWAYPMRWRNQGSLGGTIGSFGPVPVKESVVFVIFQRGDPHYPLYVGGVLRPDLALELGKENYPNRYGWVDKAGNKFWVDTTEGKNEVHFTHGGTGSDVSLDNYGNLTANIKSKDNQGGSVSIKADKGITIEAGKQLTLKGSPVKVSSGGSLGIDAATAINIAAGANLNTSSLGFTNMFSANIATIVSAVSTRILDKYSKLKNWK